GRRQTVLGIAGRVLKATVGHDGIAYQTVGVAKVDQPAGLGGSQRLDRAALVDRQVGERRVKGAAVGRGKQGAHGARRAVAWSLALHGDDGVDHSEARRQGQVQVEQHVGKVGALAGAYVELSLAQAGDAAEGELDGAGEAHQAVSLERPDLDDAVDLGPAAADREAAKQASGGRRELDHVEVGHEQLDVLFTADRRHAAYLVGAPHQALAAGAAGAVGAERRGGGRLGGGQDGG